jgi:hypothetical protein
VDWVVSAEWALVMPIFGGWIGVDWWVHDRLVTDGGGQSWEWVTRRNEATMLSAST